MNFTAYVIFARLQWTFWRGRGIIEGNVEERNLPSYFPAVRRNVMEQIKLLVAVVVVFLIPIILGILEKRRNEKNIQQLELRINVNGIRGKSTATRMITSILNEAGYNVVGKTTGTAARMMYWDQEEEEEIKRRPRGVSISEQIRVINKAVKAGADALVCECMAVRPDYQKVYQHEILHGNLVVIVNVVEDHLDEMGPTLEQLAWAFGDTIPYDGIAVVPNCEFTDYFREIAEKRGSKCYVVHPEIIPERLLKMFPYKVFDNNCAVALTVAQALDIPLDVAVRGMLYARPDPGALRITPIENGNLKTWFVNAFAANEPASTLEIWNSIQNEGLPLEDAIVVMNCRPDRVDRTGQFAHDCFPYMNDVQLMVIGEGAHPVEKAYQQGRLDNLTGYYNLEGCSVRQIMETLEPLLDGHVVFGVGNIHGIGEEFIHTLTSLQQRKVWKPKKDQVHLSANVDIDVDDLERRIADLSVHEENKYIRK